MRRRVVRVVDWLVFACWLVLVADAAWGPLIPVRVPFLVHSSITIYVLWRLIFPALIGRGEPVGEQRTAAPPLATARCAGKIGIMRFQGPLLHVSVYPERIVVRALGLGTHPILAADVISVEDTHFNGVLIRHEAANTQSPITLHLSRRHPVRASIEGFRKLRLQEDAAWDS